MGQSEVSELHMLHHASMHCHLVPFSIAHKCCIKAPIPIQPYLVSPLPPSTECIKCDTPTCCCHQSRQYILHTHLTHLCRRFNLIFTLLSFSHSHCMRDGNAESIPFHRCSLSLLKHFCGATSLPELAHKQ